jgi:hypothetical protein
MIAEARRRASALGLPIAFEQGDAEALPFEDGSFDACRAARLLEHLPNAELALTEMDACHPPQWTHRGIRLRLGHVGHRPSRQTDDTNDCAVLRGFNPQWLDRPPTSASLQGTTSDVRSFDPVQVFVHYSLAELFLGSHLTRLQTNGILSPDSAREWWDYLRRQTNVAP